MRGNGYHFEAPHGWKVRHTARGMTASRGDLDLVGVSTFRLQKAYRPAVFEAAANELDGVAARLARRLGGRVVSSSTVRAAGAEARSYRLETDAAVQELTFVLRGLREYQLLCRRKADSGDSACSTLVSSFALG